MLTLSKTQLISILMFTLVILNKIAPLNSEIWNASTAQKRPFMLWITIKVNESTIIVA